jgi:isoleucyl-tRNA synthetase
VLYGVLRTVFKEVNVEIDFPKMEHAILDFWAKTNAFKKRVELNQGKPHWSFLDGPITANNPMGVHHAWGRTYKDLFQRYRAMRGYDLRYQNGFDCQGLWIEVEVEKELGFKSKKDIESYGIAEFVKRCKQRVLHYGAVQTEQSIRLGYWMEWDDPEYLRELEKHMENPEDTVVVQGTKGQISERVDRIVSRLGSRDYGGSYFTFSDENNYTIWALLKRCHDQGWIFKGRDVMPWCPRCSTALSQHEISTEGYRELTHPGLTVRFPLRERPNEVLLVWTTTPWTLSSNVAVAVHPEMSYVKVSQGKKILYMAKPSMSRTLKGDFEVLEELTGGEMLDWVYDGPFDKFPAIKDMKVVDSHRVIPWLEVSEVEGTGIVHIAPGCGKEDFELGEEHSLPAISPLNEFGVFVEGFDWLSGISVTQSSGQIIEYLRREGLLFKLEDYTHRYPVCWRCASELVFRLVDEWFIKMGEKLEKPLDQISIEEKRRNLRYQIIDITMQTRWFPPFGLRQELDWLLNMDDWMISKKRYWGLALPIWECKKCGSFDVIGGLEELKSKAISGWEEFEGHTPHRPWIDAVKIACPKCGVSSSRILDVGNPWLDAGIVAYSTLDYVNDRVYWSKWFPADLISESLPGQFRNWFYSLLAMSAIMEGQPPFKTCMGYGLVLAEDGREMHKSWGNAIWFDDAVETMGADVMRWMYCRTNTETNMLFGYKGATETRRSFFIPLLNIYSFLVTYALLDGWTPKNIRNDFSLLDRWIVSKLQILIDNGTEDLDNYNVLDSSARLEQFVDELSRWYDKRHRQDDSIHHTIHLPDDLA